MEEEVFDPFCRRGKDSGDTPITGGRSLPILQSRKGKATFSLIDI